MIKRKRPTKNNLMIDSDIAFVIANILKVNEPLVGIPKDLGLNSPIASHNTLGNLRKLLPLVPRGYFETSEDTRLSNPDTWTFRYLLKFLPFVNHIRNRYHSTAIYNCNPLFELAFLTTYRSLYTILIVGCFVELYTAAELFWLFLTEEFISTGASIFFSFNIIM